MTTLQAYDILAISQDAGFKEVKKQYRQLMHRVHPDSGAFGTEEYPYTAQEINEAYETLRQADRETDAHALKRSSRNSSERKKHSQTASQTAWHAKYGQSQRNAEMGWDAPENTGAYTKRKIFHKVEDMDGTMISVVAIAEGKYLWKPEEDFSLFLKSILECSERLLEQKRAQVKIEVSRKQDRKNTSGKSKYKNIDFWMRIPRETTGTFPESIDLKIENLLKQYKSR